MVRGGLTDQRTNGTTDRCLVGRAQLGGNKRRASMRRAARAGSLDSTSSYVTKSQDPSANVPNVQRRTLVRERARFTLSIFTKCNLRLCPLKPVGKCVRKRKTRGKHAADAPYDPQRHSHPPLGVPWGSQRALVAPERLGWASGTSVLAWLGMGLRGGCEGVKVTTRTAIDHNSRIELCKVHHTHV